MTICIAAITDKKKIVTISDKMLTLTNPSMVTKYEISENNKAINLTSKIVALFAGDVIQGNQILSKVREKIQSQTSVSDISNLVRDVYKEQWKYVIESNLLSRYNLTIDLFMANHNRLDPDLVKRVDKVIGEFNLSVEIIVAGIDTDAHLYLITNPGVITCYDSIAYACIGSGSQHATLSLIENEYNSNFSLEKTLYALLDAKKRAEFDPGVGQLCDVTTITTSYKRIDQDDVKKIEKQYKQSQFKINKIIDKTSKAISTVLR